MPVPDYIPYTAGEYAIDAGATALHFARWFQNWEAGFGGAAGAPRLDALAKASDYVGLLGWTGADSPAGLTGLGRVRTVRFDGGLRGTSTSATTVDLSFSADGGATWGAWQAMVPSTAGVASGFLATLSFYVDLQSGAWSYAYAGATVNQSGAGTFTVPVGCNAFRIRSGSGASAIASGRGIVSIAGGRDA